jgi:hypothetical protein
MAERRTELVIGQNTHVAGVVNFGNGECGRAAAELRNRLAVAAVWPRALSFRWLAGKGGSRVGLDYEVLVHQRRQRIRPSRRSGPASVADRTAWIVARGT